MNNKEILHKIWKKKKANPFCKCEAVVPESLENRKKTHKEQKQILTKLVKYHTSFKNQKERKK